MTVVKKYAKQISQTKSNPPYATWNNLSSIGSSDYTNASCDVSEATPIPAPFKCSHFDFNLPTGCTVKSVTVDYEVHVGSNSVKVTNPNISVGYNGYRVTKEFAGNLSTGVNRSSLKFEANTELLNNLDYSDINENNFGVWFEWDNINNIRNGTVLISYINVSIEYETTGEFYLVNTENNEGFPTATSPRELEVYETFVYGLSLTSTNGNDIDTVPRVHLDLPDGLVVVGYTGNGIFDYNTDTWVPNIVNDKPVIVNFTIKAYNTGLMTLKATSNVTSSTYDYYVHVNGAKPHLNQVEDITFSIPEIRENTLNTDIEVLIESTATNTRQFVFSSTCTNDPYTFDKSKMHITVSENVADYTINGNTLTVIPINTEKHFVLGVTIPFRVIGDSKTDQELSVVNVDLNDTYTTEFYVGEHEPMLGMFTTDEYKWEWQTFHAAKMGTLTAEDLSRFIVWASCDEDYYIKDCDLGAVFEKIHGYIGPIKLERTHANAKNDTTNTEIKEQYQNRKHYGKVGDYNESRTGTLRLTPKQITTLQGLCQLDKPIAMDCEPLMADGDPLIWRGWAELTGVKNISKINHNLYECTPNVDFLTNDVNTRFFIQRGLPVRDYNLPRVLETTLFPLDEWTNYFNVSGNGEYTTEMVNSDILYDIYDFNNYTYLDTGKNIVFTSKTPLSSISTFTFDWLNTMLADVPQPYPEWNMSIRLLDAKNNNLLFEYGYYNFYHRIGDDIVNKCSTRILARKYEQYKVWGYNDLYLDWGNNVLATENLDIQLNTSLWNVTVDSNGDQYVADGADEVPTDVTFDTVGRFIEAKLVTQLNSTTIPLANETIAFTLTRLSNNATKTYYVNTDNKGVAHLQINLSNGTYECKAVFEEHGNYLGSEMSTFTFDVNLSKVATKIIAHNYDGKTQYTVNGNVLTYPILTTTGEKIEARLQRADGNGNISGEQLEFELVDNYNTNRKKTYFAKTDNTGKAELPINLDTGDYTANIRYMGNAIYQPSDVTSINFIVQLDGQGTLTKLTGKDETFYSTGKKHIVTLTTHDGKPLIGEQVDFMLSGDNTNSVKWYYDQPKTDQNGQTSIEINLQDGLYYITAVYHGNKNNTSYPEGLKPSSVRNTIISNLDSKHSTIIEADFDDGAIFTYEGQAFGGILYEYLDDNTRVPVSGETVYVTCTNGTQSTPTYAPTTDSSGHFSIPMNLSAGSYSATFQYLEDYDRNGCSKTVAFQTNFQVVVNGETQNVPQSHLNFGSSQDLVSEYATYTKTDEELTLPLILTDANGDGIEGAQITIYGCDTSSNYENRTGGVTYGAGDIPLTDSNGRTSFSIHYTGTNRHILFIASYTGVAGTIQGSTGTAHILVNYQNTNTTTNSSGQTTNNNGNIVVDDPGALETSVSITSFQSTYTSANISTGITATLLDENNSPIVGENLTWYFKDVNNPDRSWHNDYGDLTTNSNGRITIPMGLANGTYQVYVVYKGSDEYDASMSETKQFVVNNTTVATKTKTRFLVTNIKGTSKDTFIYDGSVSAENTDQYIRAVLYNANTGNVIPNAAVSWTFTRASDGASKTYTGTGWGTDQYGIAEYAVALGNGTYTIKIDYAGNSTYESCTQTIYLIVRNRVTNALVDNTVVNAVDENGNIIKYFNNVKLTDLTIGSSMVLEMEDNHIHVKDYGLSNDNGITVPKIDFETDIDPAECILQVEITNPQVAESTNINNQALRTQLWMNIMEDTENSKYLPLYQNMIISPLALPSRTCQFVRKTDEGILHYYDYNPYGDIDYLGDPRNQFEGGCDLQTADGYSVVDTSTGYNPIAICNGLIKVTFDRIGHFIKLYRYDANHDNYVLCHVLKIDEIPDIELYHYSDDKIVLNFGHTRWTIWRGHPFVQVEHPNTDLKFIKEFDHVWCEKSQNNQLGFPTEQTTSHGEFNTYYTPNFFSREYRLNEDFSLDNFELYKSKSETQLSWSVIRIDNDRLEVVLILAEDEEYAELFFPYPALMEIPNNQFNLYLGRVDCSYNCELDVIVNLYDENGRVQASNDPDPSAHTGYKLERANIQLEGGLNEVNVNFVIPSELRDKVKYMDFNLRFDNSAANHKNVVGISKFMLYEGAYQSNVEYTEANPGQYYDKMKVYFKNTYFANFYNKAEGYGVGVIKPDRESINLGRVPSSDFTCFAPYLKSSQKWDKPELVALEYMTFCDQTTYVNRIN